jgi:hypothetical protein
VILLRYLVFAVAGIAIVSALGFVLNAAITVTEDRSAGLIERWIVRALCDKYELTGTVRDAQGAPISFATVEAIYLDQRLSTRSRGDGRYELKGDHTTCEEQPETVSVFVSAEDYRAKRRVLEYGEPTLDVVLDRTDF